MVAGVQQGVYWVTNPGSFLSIPISICDGETLELIYQAGTSLFSFETENSYELLDSQGNSIFSSGLGPATGTSYIGTANCFGGISCSGGTVELIASGQGAYSYVINNDFNSGGAGTGWSASPAATFTNPCDPSIDGGTYMWMGDMTAAPRNLETNPLDVSCGGEICFYLDMATQGNASPCEGPDLPSEGVYLQYSTNGGATWNTINYFDPTTGNYTSWNQYCFTIPPAAQTTNTIFSWWQGGSSGNLYDHWGIDNVTITSLVNCAPYTYDWNHVPGSVNDSNDIVTVTQTTTYNVTYTNGTDICSTTVTVVIPDGPIITASTTSDETCPGACDGTVNSVISTGTGTSPYNISWNNGASTNSISSLCPGDYIVTVTDDNNCTYTDTTTINSGPIITAVIDPVGAQCLTSNSFTFNGANSTISSGSISTYSWDFGDGQTGSGPNPSHAYSAAGSYIVSLIVSDGNCSDVTTLNIIVWEMPVPTITGTDETCAGICNGTIDLSVTGSGGYTYNWDNGAGNNQDPTGLCPNNYNVLITDINGCQATSSFTIGTTPPLVLNIVGTDVLCNGDDNGTATVTASGGTPVYSYSWDPSNGPNQPGGGQGTSSVIGLTGGVNYTVTVTDDNNCTETASYTVNEPTALVGTLGATTDVLCNGNADGSATVSANGGTSPYTYDIGSGAQASGSFTGLSAGTYTVTITDDNNCTTTVPVTIIEPTAFSGSVSLQNDITCNGGSDGSATIAASGGTSPYTYDIGSGTQASGSFTGLSAGAYTVTITDDNNCTATVPVTINEPTALVGTLDATTDVLCNGNADGSATVSANGGTSPYTYDIGSGAQASGSFTGLSAGTYTVTITDDNNCTTTVPVTIIEPTAFSGSVSLQNDITCNGGSDGSATIAASGGTSPYTYDIGSGTQASGSFTGLSAGAYTVTITDDNNCTTTVPVTINEPTTLVGTLDATTDVLCNGGADGSATVSSNGGTSPYTYDIGSGAQASGSFTGLSAGTYTVTITDDNGCTSTVGVTINEPTALSGSISLQNDVTCNGGSDGSATIIASGGTSPYTYDIGSGAQASGSFTGLSAGAYTVTITDDNNCTTTVPVTINEPTTLVGTLDATTDVLCNGDADGSATVSASGGTSPYTYDIGFGAQASGTFNGLTAGTYTVTITDDNNCTTTVPVSINEPTLLSISLINTIDATCGLANGSIEVSASGGTNPLLFDIGGTQQSSGIFNTLTPGSYDVTVTDDNGCSEMITVTVADLSGLTAVIDSQTDVDCFGNSTGAVTVTGSGSTAPYTYDIGAGTQATGTFTGLAAGAYTVTVTDDNGCIFPVAVTINEPTAFSGSVSLQNDITCNGGSDGSATIAASGGTSPYTYDIGAGTQASGSFTGLSAGAYTVTITDDNNCTTTVPVTINEPTALVGTLDATTDVLCNGGSDGSATVSAAGGTSPYTYDIGFGAQASGAFNGLTAGTYTVTITDDNNCTTTVGLTINEPVVLSSNTVSVTDATCGLPNGAFEVTGVDGTAPYQYSNDNGVTFQASGSYSGLTAGSYDILIQDDNGCQTTITVTVADLSGLTAVIDSQTDVDCFGNSTGAVTVTGSGSTAPYTYDIGAGTQATGTFTGLAAGAYTVTVTDDNGCIFPVAVTINEPTALTTTATGTDPLCNGSSDGSANITISGGTGPYTTIWQHGPTAEDLIGVLGAGTYTLDITDDNNCPFTVSITLTNPPAITSSITGTDVSCNGGSDGTATVTASGGTGTLTYNWSPVPGTGQGTASATGLAPLTYTVTVTDDNGCFITESYTPAEPTIITLTTSSINSNCGQADGQVSVSATGGTPVYTYLWDDPSASTTATVTGLAAAVYNVTVTDDNNCTQTISATITDAGGGTVSHTQTDVFCFGGNNGSIDATITGGTSPFNYSWSGPSGFTSSSEDITGLMAGTYDLIVTDAVGCIITLSVTITEPTQLSLSPSGINVTCFGGSDGEITTTAGGGAGSYTFEWFDNAALSSSIGTGSSITGLSAGTYYVQVTDANGCTFDNNLTITEPNDIVVNTSVIDANCGQADGVVSVASTTGGSGVYVSEVWTDASGNTVANTTAVIAGTYFVTVTDDIGCQGTGIANVSDLSGPVAQIDGYNDVLCNSDCNGNANVTVGGGSPNYTFLWSPSPGAGQGTSSVSGLCAGIYTVDVTDINGCATSVNVTISEPTVVNLTQLSTVSTSGAGICDGQASVSTTGGTSPYSYSWFNDCMLTIPNGLLSGTNVNGLCAGDYGVVVIDDNNCPDTLCITITEPNAIIVTLTGNNTLCNGSCNGDATATVIGGIPPYSYQWFSSPSGTAIGQSSITASNLCVGDYYVEVTDDNGIIAVSSAYTINEPANITATTAIISNYNGQDISCNGACDGSAEVTPSGGTPPYTYLWDANAGGQTTPIAINLCAGVYNVDVTDDYGCTSTFSVNLSEPTALVNSNTYTDVTCNGFCDGTATASPSGGVAPYTYLWNNTALSITSSISNLCPGAYDVIVTDDNGCTTVGSSTITEPNPLVVTTSSNGSNCNQNDGDGTVSIVSGTPSYNYQWDTNAGSQTTATASNLFAGCYDVIITEGNGCIDTVNVCVFDLGAPSVSILTQTDVSCFNGCDGFAQIQVFGGAPPVQYNWYDQNNQPINQTTASAFNLCAGNYTGEMIDANGCQATISVTINQPNALNGVISSTTDVTCFGDCDGNTTITASSGTGPYTYSWNDPSNQTSATATNLCPGNYNVTITDDNGCTLDIPSIIGEPLQIQLSTSSIDAYCNTPSGSATVTLTNGGLNPVSYLWTPTGQTNSTASNLNPGIYDVTVTDADGCTATTTATIGNIPPGTATISSTSNTLCHGSCDGAATVSMGGSGNAPYTYNWYTSTGVNLGQNLITVNNLCVGFYFCEVTDANGCIATTGQFDITEPSPINLITSNDSTNCNSNCDGNAYVVANGGTGPYTYQWDDPLLQITTIASSLCAGTYNITVTDDNGCNETSQTTIFEPTALSLDSSVTNAICGQANGQGCVLVSGGTGPFTYLWPDLTSNSCNVGLIAGSYIVQVTDGNNCTESIVVEISDLNGPIATIINSDSTLCNGSCDGSATVDMTGGSGNLFTVQWDANTGSQITPTASNLCTGTYTVTITDDLGCSASTSVSIEEPDTLQFIKNFNNPSCFGYCDGQMWVNIVGGTLPYSYDWRDNANNSLGINNDSISSMCAGTYNLIVTDANGCVIIINYNINNPLQVTGSTTTTDVLCNGACDGTATANGLTGNTPFNYIWDVNAGSQTTQTASGLCPGTYTVTITDANGCFNTAQATITEPTLLTSSITLFSDVSCNNFCDGFAQIDVQGGTPGYSYTWNNNAGTNQTASSLCAGTYLVIVNDNNNCTTSSSITISEPNPLAVSNTTIDLACFEVCQGDASVSVSGGTGPYSFQWDDPNFTTTSTATNLCAGAYNCIITDNNSCNITETVVITQPTQLTMSINATDANCGQANGQICITPVGGTAPFTYQWNDPFNQTSACAINLLTSCYTGTILDANGCSIDSVICINDILGPNVNVANTIDLTCFGYQNGTVEFNVTGGSGVSTLVWFDNQGNTITQGSGLTLLSNLDGGCYTLQATDNAGCISSETVCINEPNPMTSSIFNFNNVSCNQGCDGEATVNVVGGTIANDYAYSWNDPNAQDSSTAVGLCAGTYTVTVIDDNNCSIQSSILINDPLPINIFNVTTNNTSCYNLCNGSSEIFATGGTPPYFYSWDNGASSTLNTNLCDGNYTVIVTDANSCQDSLTITITEPDSISISINSNNATCNLCNGDAVVQASGGTGAFNYNWFGIGNSPNNSINSGLCSGNLQVEVTDANGCSNTISAMIIDEGMPTIDQMSFTSPLCNGLSNGTATVVVSGGITPYSYLWDDPAQQQVPTAVALNANTYCVTITDANGCVTSNCINVTEPNILNAVPDLSSTICYGDSTQVWASGQGGTSPYTIHWLNPNLLGPGPNTVNPLTTTDYCFTVTDANGCLSSNACVTITVTPPLSLNLTPSMNICSGGSIDVNAVGAGGDGNPYIFSWTDEFNNTLSSVQVGDSSTVFVAPTTPTWYYVTLSDGCSIEVTDSTQIGLNPNPQAFVIAVDSSDCAPFNAQFIINSDIGDLFEFDIDCDGTPEYSGPNNTFNYTYTLSGIYDLCVRVENTATGCDTSIFIQDMIEIFDIPQAFFTADPEQTSILNPNIDFLDGSINGTDYIWDFGDNTSINGDINDVIVGDSSTFGTITQPTHIYSDTGYYTITLTITSDEGCIDSYQQTIYVEGDYILFAPSAFTPNGDGKNDIFMPEGIGIYRDHFEFYVFNRWGELIFESYNPELGWDGTYMNKTVQLDAYVWMIRTWDYNDVPHEYMGHVTVVK